MSDVLVKLPSKEEFAEHVNENFKVRLNEDEVFDFLLLKVKTSISNAYQECFTLVFRAPLAVPPFQNLFQLEHPKLGAMSLLLVPFKQEDDGLYFDAVFNNLVK